ncbi:MAG: hypothetical protein C0425_02430 [Chlorobiaceae bacterium]|nr:hypothetical protein [Chlorobiaceae bacterium]MBA4309177.1 hypothetical protein [Chlorobiaceae bacterium]
MRKESFIMSEVRFTEPEFSDNQEQSAEPPSFTDKVVGVFSEPTQLFKRLASFPPKPSDWIIPILLLLLVVSLSRVAILSNPIIEAAEKQKMFAQIDSMVVKGQIPVEQADKIKDQQEKMFENKAISFVFQSIGIFIFGFLVILLVSGVYFLFAKFVFKGTGTYQGVLIANAQAAWITIVYMIILTIISLVLNKSFLDLSIASFIDANRKEFTGFLLSKIDIIAIWSYVVAAIGMSKFMFSDDSKKYIFMVIGIWITWSFLFFFVLKEIPFLANFG